MRPRISLDYWLIIPTILLIAIGLTTLATLNLQYFKSQLISLVISSIFFFIFINMNYENLLTMKKPIYFLSIILLIMVLIIGIESRGAVRWIDFFGIRFQISEILKPFLSLSLASQISQNYKPGFKIFLINLFLLIPIFILIYLQPDLGSALIYGLVFSFCLIVMGFPLKWFIIILTPLILASPILWNHLHQYQRDRFLSFLNFSQDTQGISYNSIQAMIAVGSGMFFGKGLGESTQSGLRFLPERHTDFIFASLTEGLGFIGGALVIIAFFMLLYRLYHLICSASSIADKSFLICTFSFISIQFFFNMGMNIGILPVIGITLPFVSFGGSSLLANSIFLAVACVISNKNSQKGVLEIR